MILEEERGKEQESPFMPGGQAVFARVGAVGGWHTVVPTQAMWILLQPKEEAGVVFTTTCGLKPVSSPHWTDCL